MQFLKGLTRWFHFDKHLAKIERCRSCELPLDSTGMCPQCGEYPNDLEDDEPQSKLLPELSRRGFLMGLGAAAVVAALPEIPLGRVWSIPKFIPGYMTRFDEINRRTWGSVAWGNQSMALQIEHIRDKLPLLYEHDDIFTDLLNVRGSGPTMGKRIALYAEQNVRQANARVQKTR